MPVNIGTVDRILRATLGAALLYLALASGAAVFEAGLWKWIAVAGGVIMLATSAIKFCPLYRLVGLRTCKAG